MSEHDRKSNIFKFPIPPKPKSSGRKRIYNFWGIPPGQGLCRIFKDVDAHRLTAALAQFKRTYGGEFKVWDLRNGVVAVYCLKEPRPKE